MDSKCSCFTYNSCQQSVYLRASNLGAFRKKGDVTEVKKTTLFVLFGCIADLDSSLHRPDFVYVITDDVRDTYSNGSSATSHRKSA